MNGTFSGLNRNVVSYASPTVPVEKSQVLAGLTSPYGAHWLPLM